MTFDEILRRMRGALGNAVVWGAFWFVAALAVSAVALVVGALPSGGSIWLTLLSLPVRVGVLGFFAGGAFSLAIGLLLRGRRLSELRWERFGMGGALVGAVFMPLLLQFLNVLSGDGPIPWRYILDDVPWMTVFGAGVAAGTLKLAQYADKLRPGDGTASLEEAEVAERLASGGARKP